MNGNMNFNQQPMNNNFNQGMMNNNMNPNMNMNMNQGMMNGGMGMGQPQMQQPVQAPLDPEAEKKKKKIIGLVKKLVFFIIIFIVMFFGKRYLDKITYDYKTDVENALDTYYVSGNTTDLDPIKDLLAEYEDNDKVEKDIQTIVYNEVGQWFVYIDNKYVCDETNANSCAAQLVEFKKLDERLENMQTIKGGGYFIITPDYYKSLLAEAQKKINGLYTATRSSKYTSPDNSETIHKNTCDSISSSSDDCSCRDGICTCTYYEKDADGNKTAKSISCYKEETLEDK